MALPKSLTTVTPLSKTLAMILFIALPFLGFLLGMQYQEVIDFQNQQVTAPVTLKPHPAPSTIAQPSRSTASAETANWKTYKNSEYSFKYPANFIIKERQNRYSFMTTQKISTLFVEDNNQESLLYLEIFSEENPRNLTSEQFLNDYLDRLNEDDGPETRYVVKKVRSSLKPYDQGNINGMYALLGWDYDFDTIVQTRNNRVYTFLYSATNAGNQKYQEQIINQILSTFKFIE